MMAIFRRRIGNDYSGPRRVIGRTAVPKEWMEEAC